MIKYSVLNVLIKQASLNYNFKLISESLTRCAIAFEKEFQAFLGSSLETQTNFENLRLHFSKPFQMIMMIN